MSVLGEGEEGLSGGEVEEAGMGLKHHIRGEVAGECLDHRLEEVFLEDRCLGVL